MSHRARAVLMVCLVAGTTALVACGQRGALYLPTDPAATGRATLPQLLTPDALSPSSSNAAVPAPAAAASAPAAPASARVANPTPEPRK
ncbi:lipoprotein [Variovorax sp. H27-G14]